MSENKTKSISQLCYSALYAVARPSVRPSVCLSVTWVDHWSLIHPCDGQTDGRTDGFSQKTVEVRIMQLSPRVAPWLTFPHG